MGVNGMASLSAQFLVPMESVCGKILDEVGPLCLVIFCMKLEMGQKCNFGKIGGVERYILLTATLNYLGFSKTRRQVWLNL